MNPDIPILSADEAADLLQRLLEKDVAIEALHRDLLQVEIERKRLKGEIEEAEEARSRLSHEIRNPPPLFARDGNGNPHGAAPDRPMTSDEVNAEVVAGVREAEAEKKRGRKAKARAEAAS